MILLIFTLLAPTRFPIIIFLQTFFPFHCHLFSITIFSRPHILFTFSRKVQNFPGKFPDSTKTQFSFPSFQKTYFRISEKSIKINSNFASDFVLIWWGKGNPKASCSTSKSVMGTPKESKPFTEKVQALR